MELATLSVALDQSSSLTMNESAAFGRTSANWEIHEKHPKSPDSIDLTGCIASKDKSGFDNLVEIKYIAFVGTPSFMETKFPVEIEAVMNLESYKADKFRYEQRSGLRGIFGITKAKPLSKNQGYVMTKSSIVKISKSSDLVPADVFETRVTCLGSRCNLDRWYGCFHVVCRAVTGMDLAMQNVYHQAKETTQKNMEAAKKLLLEDQQRGRIIIQYTVRRPIDLSFLFELKPYVWCHLMYGVYSQRR